MNLIASRALVGAGALCFLFTSSPAVAIQLITNGGFETGNFAAWTVVDSGSGSFEVTASPFPSNGVYPTVGPFGGVFYAVSSQDGPGTHALIQPFTVPGPASSVILSYNMFVQTQAPPVVNPAGLDHNAFPNQHARVDILSPFSGPFDTGAGVLANYYLGIDGPPTLPYTSYTIDITSVVGGGGTFLLRFAQTDNQGNFNQGVDNVRVECTLVPEPASITLVLLVAVMLLGVRRRVA